ncbi:IclR family transcriptional regulator [Arthrobacter sp. H41]|uniref:IclR family transcriptional regulator n=1 Tax=Arthrobacter sp. H41 TaxID=1312978 RepID=UPI0004BAD65C|nr:IclR family transcriptional regulator [Arthrobacter sp. H41]
MENDDGAKLRSGVQSIDRAVAILRCFDSRNPELGITEVAKRTGLSTSTAHRILASMAANRLIRQTSDKRYGLGPLLIQLARNGAIPTTFRDVAMPFMMKLRDEVDETVGLHELLSTGERAVIDQAESRQEIRRHYTDIGVPVPLPHGAPGKVILSVLPWDRQEWWLSRSIRPVTPATVTDPDRLRAELSRIRDQGWADSNAERTTGIRAVAAPIFDHTGSVIGAVGLSVPSMRIDEGRAALLGLRAKETAWEISEALGASDAAVKQNFRRALAPGEQAAE